MKFFQQDIFSPPKWTHLAACVQTPTHPGSWSGFLGSKGEELSPETCQASGGSLPGQQLLELELIVQEVDEEGGASQDTAGDGLDEILKGLEVCRIFFYTWEDHEGEDKASLCLLLFQVLGVGSLTVEEADLFHEVSQGLDLSLGGAPLIVDLLLSADGVALPHLVLEEEEDTAEDGRAAKQPQARRLPAGGESPTLSSVEVLICLEGVFGPPLEDKGREEGEDGTGLAGAVREIEGGQEEEEGESPCQEEDIEPPTGPLQHPMVGGHQEPSRDGAPQEGGDAHRVVGVELEVGRSLS